MAIQKQEFYEGAALHQLIRGSSRTTVSFLPPLFVFDGRLQAHLKYSTAKRSPWTFTFMPEEQYLLQDRATKLPLIIGLVCGADGIAALPYDAFLGVAAVRSAALRISCRRNHRQHYEISGPDGVLSGKVAPSDWGRLLSKKGSL